MKYDVTNERLMRLHHETGLPVLSAKGLLVSMPPAEQENFIVALESAQGRILRDPIEDDPNLGPIIGAVLDAVGKQVQDEHDAHIKELAITSPAVAHLFKSGRGLCHAVWLKAKQQLKDEHGIDWKTPAEMNPWKHFD